MIDGVGKSAATGRVEISRASVERNAPVARTGDAVEGGKARGPSSAVADLVSSGPPVDAAKVAAIKAAIASGNYPVDPDKIAERMIALDLPDRG
ncbi:MAG: flagellar biosynthesis anti-sigma factor FlgM [Allosphingosinicella sp.]|uniref:flagellar biosynthesis anti-sigma factor FlgM n=1 Tax=Allosphingosinicella sp. TaxID=2823234 RepID=UPI003948D0E1